MIIRIQRNTTIRAALDRLPAPAVAWMLDRGLLKEWPLEFTRRGRRAVKVVFV